MAKDIQVCWHVQCLCCCDGFLTIILTGWSAMIDKDSSFGRYLRDISKYPRISLQREHELSCIIREGNNEEQVEAAIEELVNSNLRLVVHCLKDFSGYLSSSGIHISRMDLIAEGNLALINSARKFDSSHGCDEEGGRTRRRFSSYACKSIKCAMRRALMRGRMIHIPEYHFAHWSEIKTLREEYGEMLTDDILASHLDVNNTVLKMIKTSEGTHTCMLEDLVAGDDDGAWESFMPNSQSPSPLEEAQQHDLRSFLFSEIQKLPTRTARMIQSRFMLDNNMSLAEMAEEFGVSAERCRQVCCQGLEKLRSQLMVGADDTRALWLSEIS